MATAGVIFNAAGQVIGEAPAIEFIPMAEAAVPTGVSLETALGVIGTDVAVDTAAGTIEPGGGNIVGAIVGLTTAAITIYGLAKLTGKVSRELTQLHDGFTHSLEQAKSGEEKAINDAINASRNYVRFLEEEKNKGAKGFEQKLLDHDKLAVAQNLAAAVSTGLGAQYKKFDGAMHDKSLDVNAKRAATEKYLGYLKTRHDLLEAVHIKDPEYDNARNSALVAASGQGVKLPDTEKALAAGHAFKPGSARTAQGAVRSLHSKDARVQAAQEKILKLHPELAGELGTPDGLAGPNFVGVLKNRFNIDASDVVDSHGYLTQAGLANLFGAHQADLDKAIVDYHGASAQTTLQSNQPQACQPQTETASGTLTREQILAQLKALDSRMQEEQKQSGLPQEKLAQFQALDGRIRGLATSINGEIASQRTSGQPGVPSALEASNVDTHGAAPAYVQTASTGPARPSR